MEITGTVKEILPLESGEGKNGTWKKQTVVIGFKDGNYDKILALETMNKVTEHVEKLGIGMEVTASVNVSSREYNGKYYTNAQAWKIVGNGNANVNTPTTAPSGDESKLPF